MQPPQKDIKNKRFPVKAVLSLIIALLVFTNAATFFLLIRTGEILMRIIAESDGAVPLSVILDYAEEDKITTEFLQRFFSDRIVVWSDGEIHLLPVDKTLEPSRFDRKAVGVNEDGRRVYLDGSRDISLFGIDVSSHQGEIDWQAVKGDGVDFAIIRLGYRGYGTGEIKLDALYESNMRGAATAQIPTGVYFYSQAITTEEAVAEADFVLQYLEGFSLTYPVVFDMEEIGEQARTDLLDNKARTDIAIAFCERIKQSGYTPMIYGNIRWLAMNLELNRLEAYDKWFAQYFKQPFFPYDFAMWQYTSSGRVSGIEGNVDLNMGLFDYESSTPLI